MHDLDVDAMVRVRAAPASVAASVTAMAMAMSMAAANYDAIAFGRAHATAVHEGKEGCGGKEDAVHNDKGLVG